MTFIMIILITYCPITHPIHKIDLTVFINNTVLTGIDNHMDSVIDQSASQNSLSGAAGYIVFRKTHTQHLNIIVLKRNYSIQSIDQGSQPCKGLRLSLLV